MATDNGVELVGAYWTTAGPTQPHQGQEWSNFDFGDRCAEAAKAGMKGIGIWHADLVHARRAAASRRSSSCSTTTD